MESFPVHAGWGALIWFGFPEACCIRLPEEDDRDIVAAVGFPTRHGLLTGQYGCGSGSGAGSIAGL